MTPGELMDLPLPAAATERALADLDRVNRLLLGHLPAVRALVPRIAGAAAARQRLLDLGTGSGDGAARLARAARRRGARLTVVGLDRKLSHLVAGRRRGVPQLRVVGDAAALPFADASFDWSLSTLLFHHFDADGNRRILDEMRRTSRRGAVVVDLRRGWLTRWLARLLLPLLGLGPVARHDGLLSAARAWELGEVARLVADLPVAELRGRFPRRFSLVIGPP